jgi:hypothetical protein
MMIASPRAPAPEVRRVIRRGLLACLVAVAACSDLGELPRDVCGNGLLEAGEDCDSDDPRCVRCAVTCTTTADCPTSDYACGVDGFCHAPGGVLAEPTAPVTFQADDLVITDVDRDGFGDVLGVSGTSIVVHHGDAAGSLVGAISFVTPAQTGPHVFGDLDGDGTLDVTLATLDGLVSYTSRFGTLAPVAIESPLFDATGEPLNLRTLFAVGQFQLGAFIEDAASGAVLLVVIDLVPPGEIYATAPCFARLGPLSPVRIQQPSLDIYRASPAGAVGVDLVLAFLTDTGQPCVMSIDGSPQAGYTFADVTPPGVAPLTRRPVLADLDTDADPCPSLVSSNGGAQGLRHWKGRLVGGRCTLDSGGASGVRLPDIPGAPPGAVAIGRAPLTPAIAGVGSDVLVMTSGVYAHVPGFQGFVELYGSPSRSLAHVAHGDLDRDGDVDIVLAAEGKDDLDVLYRVPLGVQLLRVDTASEVTSLTIGDFDGNGIGDIAYTETGPGHQQMRIAYGTPDRPTEPIHVATFSGVSSVTPLSFPDSVDTLALADDLAVIHLGDTGDVPTMSLLHGSPQRTMLSFFDPRSDSPLDVRAQTILRGGVIGAFASSPSSHRDLLAIGSPRQGATVGMRAFRVAGTARGLDPTPTAGVDARGLAACDGSGVCVASARYLAWTVAPGRDVVIAVDGEHPPRAVLLDPWASSSALTATELPQLVEGVPAGASARSLYAVDVDGDGTRELLVAFAPRAGGSGGSVRLCEVSPAGVPGACREIAEIVATFDPAIVACTAAAPGRVAPRHPHAPPSAATDLVVLCHGAQTTALYRVSLGSGTPSTSLLAPAAGVHALAVADVTGDGIDDVVAVQRAGGSQSVIVFPQCSSRTAASCRAGEVP